MVSPAQSASPAHFDRPTILVVEDEFLVRLAIADHLRDRGFNVVEADCGDSAIAFLGQAESAVDVLFTDVQMPGQADGIQLVHWIRGNRPNVAVIVTSGDAAKIAAARLLLKHEPVLPKPYDFEHVVETVRTVLGERRFG
jgi:CheY-like chemotaxis protein